ncbi:cuticle protein CP14.6-like [Amphibalanus amphitrite]|uniref:cuticle protein CP14.6-like n=1 Tax=Amphibalanus amphitrite TaxID=1232801 RepID=UPI001C912A66|nr:cuticle protein CP14.6-like [Amphibalanus amphitrite]
MRTVLLICFISLAFADEYARIVNYQSRIDEDGAYKSTFETTNGIKASEEGISYPGNVPNTGNYVRSGSYSYEWEGVTYTVNWTADENGFHPVGDHLPDFSHTRQHIGYVSDYE